MPHRHCCPFGFTRRPADSCFSFYVPPFSPYMYNLSVYSNISILQNKAAFCKLYITKSELKAGCFPPVKANSLAGGGCHLIMLSEYNLPLSVALLNNALATLMTGQVPYWIRQSSLLNGRAYIYAKKTAYILTNIGCNCIIIKWVSYGKTRFEALCGIFQWRGKFGYIH